MHQSSNGLKEEINLRLLDIWWWKSKSFFDNFFWSLSTYSLNEARFHETFLQICRWFSWCVRSMDGWDFSLVAVFFIRKTPLPFLVDCFFAHHDFTRFFFKILIWIFWFLNQIWCLFTFLLSLYRYWDFSEENLLIICAKAPNYR